MNVLMIYPEFPDTFWSFKHALPFVGKRASFPPLGLLTVAALLPGDWNKRLVDENVTSLRESDLAWADYAFVSGMAVQKAAAKRIVARCKAAGVKVVAGGPLFTMEPGEFGEVDHLVLNEAEVTLPRFLADLAAGRAERIYTTDGFAELEASPTPAWELVDLRRYRAVGVQYSRGCPFHCDFCNITSLLGKRVRTKKTSQILAELDELHVRGWRGNVFFVDDNFIGNKRQLKDELLPNLVVWRKGKRGFDFQTEASINLADDSELMDRMVEAGFDTVFVGIETSNEAALVECNKKQNSNRDLVGDVKRMQQAGLQVQGGFIVGFDHDNAGVFRLQCDLIQRSGIVTAMVGLLQAPLGTELYRRMRREGRIRGAWSGDNVEGSTNIIPKMGLERLSAGYRQMLHHLYSPGQYYARVRVFLSEYRPKRAFKVPPKSDLMAFVLSIFKLGVLGRERVHYWKLLGWTLWWRPGLLPMAVTLAINGYHFRRVCELHVR